MSRSTSLAPRLLAMLGAASIVAALPGLAIASDPASHEVTAPTTTDQTVMVEWTGLIPPGAEPGDCGPISDSHIIELTVPTADPPISLSASFFLDYSGDTVDAKITVVKPDGSSVTGDGGFVDTNESVTLSSPPAGTYDVRMCMFAGVLPQDYVGRMVLTSTAVLPTIASGPACAADVSSPKFEQAYVDEHRAGGEPMITRHPDGTLLWGSHAGTTHFFGPAAPDPTTAAFLENYEGQTYQYWSDDDGATWNFASRSPVSGDALGGLPASGFSDPEFAIDAAGNVFASEINLANVAVSKSTDSGRTWSLQNITGFTLTDRQWNAADEEDVLYMTGNAILGGTFPGNPVGTSGHVLTKSVDGGVTWAQPEVANDAGLGDIQVDPSDGTLYELSESGGVLSMAAFRDIRDRESDFADGLEYHPIATGLGLTGVSRQIGPTFDLDTEGNLYVVWEETGQGARPQGIYYSYSTDRAATWHLPVRVDTSTDSNIWPWIAVHEPGVVSIVYLEIPVELPFSDSELAPSDAGWSVVSATTVTGLGCGTSSLPGFTYTTASDGPVHHGTICNGGTICQAEAVDRRLGDYFSNEFTADGKVAIAVSDTNQGGSISLPLHIRQVSGGEPTTPSAPPETPPAAPLPVTGGGLALAGLALLTAAGLTARSRRTTE